MIESGRLPSRRALAALARLNGFRIQRSWPFVAPCTGGEPALGVQDLLEFQHARSRHFTALVVGAFDGKTNDPSAEFIGSISSKAILIEPQPRPSQELRERYANRNGVFVLSAAIDEVSGSREMYCVAPGDHPAWCEQIASFSLEHVLKHAGDVPQIQDRITSFCVQTYSFDDVMRMYDLDRLDLLQIDAEGLDAKLIEWFPFAAMAPGLVYYETAHMSQVEHDCVTQRLERHGYKVLPSVSGRDDMAVLW